MDLQGPSSVGPRLKGRLNEAEDVKRCGKMAGCLSSHLVNAEFFLQCTHSECTPGAGPRLHSSIRTCWRIPGYDRCRVLASPCIQDYTSFPRTNESMCPMSILVAYSSLHGLETGDRLLQDGQIPKEFYQTTGGGYTACLMLKGLFVRSLL